MAIRGDSETTEDGGIHEVFVEKCVMVECARDSQQQSSEEMKKLLTDLLIEIAQVRSNTISNTDRGESNGSKNVK